MVNSISVVFITPSPVTSKYGISTPLSTFALGLKFQLGTGLPFVSLYVELSSAYSQLFHNLFDLEIGSCVTHLLLNNVIV